MGCFDFTYCDSGKKLRVNRGLKGNRGYIYITKAFQRAGNLKSPIAFSGSDVYGNFTCKIEKLEISIDIYALIAAQVYLLDPKDPNTLKADSSHYDTFIASINDRNFDNSFKESMRAIRNDGIEYFFDTLITIPPEFHKVPKIENQKKRYVVIKYVVITEKCNAEVPLLISKKKIPQSPEDDLVDIAENWGFVSDSDPNQGWPPNYDHYVKYN